MRESTTANEKGLAGDAGELLILLQGWVLVEVQELKLDATEHPSLKSNWCTAR
jgi:hypothetical protein